jgi:VIT1/CCC1 family predicted Fe2+/Mn2+ transporter
VAKNKLAPNQFIKITHHREKIKMAEKQKEQHRMERIGWLRAAVLGANDGIVSTASLIVGVAAASAGRSEVLVAGIAGLVAGAMSMAAGEYVSVSSQADTEQADLERERRELATEPEKEFDELTSIYMKRGLDESLAKQVATQLMSKDALAAHMRDELGLSEVTAANPIQAAMASAATFAVGAALPLLLVLIVPLGNLVVVEFVMSLLFLALLGAVAAKAGGSSVIKASLRVAFWGAFAMGLTALIGRLFGTQV